MIGLVGQRGHIAGDDIEEMLGPARAVRDAAPERLTGVQDRDAQRRIGEPGQVDSRHRATEPAAYNDYVFHENEPVAIIGRIYLAIVLAG